MNDDVNTEQATGDATELRALLARALPLLDRLGDFIGNGPIDPVRAASLGERCDLILDVKTALGLLGPSCR